MDVETVRPTPQESARAAGLTYVSDEEPGITRKPWGRGFTYLDPEGEHIRDEAERARLDALAIPPAWREVWISIDPDAHLLVTGRDEAGRKQYIYHPDWHEVRNQAKFEAVIAFGRALPALRERVERDLRKRKLSREKVLAAVVRLLEATLIRVGNDSYARDNGSYGLTTLRDKHVRVDGSRVRFEFTGKSGVQHSVEIDDARLARVVKACRDVPGYDLFQYYDDEGNRQTIGSGDVNDYLREATGMDFTAKDFRTWAGTVLALSTLRHIGPTDNEREAHRRILNAVDAVAEQLNNTRAVCRDYYIHPDVLDRYLDGDLEERCADPESIDGLHPEECAVLTLLEAAE